MNDRYKLSSNSQNFCTRSGFDKYSNTCTFRSHGRPQSRFYNLETPIPYPAEKNCEFHIVCPADHVIEYRVIKSEFIPGDVVNIGGQKFEKKNSKNFQVHMSNTMDIGYVTRINRLRQYSGLKMMWRCSRRKTSRQIDIVQLLLQAPSTFSLN